MSSSFFASFDCVNSSTALTLKENIPPTSISPRQTLPTHLKIAYSLKDKKLVEKTLPSKRGLKSLKRANTFNLQQKQNVRETENVKKQVKTLIIIREVAVQFQPCQKSIQIQTQPLLINKSLLKTPSSSYISVENEMRSSQSQSQSQELQLCGAQSVVLMKRVGLKKQISNQSTECKCQTGGNTSIILSRKENPEAVNRVRQDRSVSSFIEMVQNSSKTTYTSVLVTGKFKCSKIDQQNSDNSQSLKNINKYSKRKGNELLIAETRSKTSQISSTFAVNNSIAPSAKSKLIPIKKFDELQVRSAESINEDQSVDEFSQVLSKSQISTSSKKISLSGLILSKKLYHFQ